MTGTPAPEISWYQDSQRIDEGLQKRFDLDGDIGGQSVLRIDQMTPDHSGNYLCRAKNPGGETVSSAAIRVVRKYVMWITLRRETLPFTNSIGNVFFSEFLLQKGFLQNIDSSI